jgi:hypothetical protein
MEHLDHIPPMWKKDVGKYGRYITSLVAYHLQGSICIATDGLDTYFVYGQEPVDIHSVYHDIYQQNLSLFDAFSIVDGIGIAQEDALNSISCTLSTDLYYKLSIYLLTVTYMFVQKGKSESCMLLF